MKRGRWVWGIIGFIVVIGFAIAYLVRPSGPAAWIERFHPHTGRLAKSTTYVFFTNPTPIDAAIPGARSGIIKGPAGGLDPKEEIILLPDSQKAVFIVNPVHANEYGPPYDSVPGIDPRATCVLMIEDDERPWYQRAWSTVRGRLGL